ncbi:hypothetical protein [Halothiobacillus diazotrophicus]|nr:hypothetical protein [Halothiobacillus diazotrophicus]
MMYPIEHAPLIALGGLLVLAVIAHILLRALNHLARHLRKPD